jgi:hydroxymethylpyrimidine/phosphomethylpyrimidine kinase
LTFGPSDPSAGGGIQGDLLTCASMSCHALTVLTGFTVQDSAGIEEAEPMSPDWIDDQARSLLEDMPVRAFKVGGMFTPETVSVIAEVLADYPNIPMILHLGADPAEVMDAETADTAEEVLAATLELLVPQALVVVVDGLRLEQLATDGLLDLISDHETGEQALLRMGAGYVLSTGLHRAGDVVVNSLFMAAEEADEQVLAEYNWPRLPGNFRGAGGTLATALSALMAGGMEVRDAAAEAQEYTWQALSAGFQPGMGRILPDRFFWARQAADAAAAAAAAAGDVEVDLDAETADGPEVGTAEGTDEDAGKKPDADTPPDGRTGFMRHSRRLS